MLYNVIVIIEYIKKFNGHLSTITLHRHYVLSMCFKCGMYKQGLLHDLSKYSFEEFWPSVKYFQGNRSPITYEKEIKGYSKGWLHHKGRNKHHWEYWIDRKQTELVTIAMPFNYVLESVLDKIAASKVYQKDKYNEAYPYEFFMQSYEINVMNKNTSNQIRTLLFYLKNNGEYETLKYIKELYRKWKRNKDFKI